MAIYHRFSKRISNKFAVRALVFIAVVFAATILLSRRSSHKLVPCAFRVEGSCVVLERVQSTKDLQIGLSNRDRLSPSRGMLFVFPNQNEHCMWMKDMRFDVDMIWVEQDGTITKVMDNVLESTYPQSFCKPSAYVVEVNAGIAARAELKPGDKLSL